MSTTNRLPMPNSVHFEGLPSFANWIKASDEGVPFPKPPRRNSPILLKIDNLVLALNHAKDIAARNYLLSVLWFTTGYWHNHPPERQSKEIMRKPAIMGLLLFAQNELGKALGCGAGGLAGTLTQLYGKTMSAHGHFCDFAPVYGEQGKNYYMNEAERDRFRIIFKNKLAYAFDLRPGTPKGTPLVLLHTFNGIYNITDTVFTDDADRGWGFFVMSMSSEIFMAPHLAGKDSKGNVTTPKFHSSYMGGNTVLCGGTMRVVNGVVTGLKNDSGHYKPSNESMVKVLELFQNFGMDLHKVEVRAVAPKDSVPTTGEQTEAKKGPEISTGDVFLQNNGNWEAIRKRSRAPMYNDLTTGKKTLFQLVNEYYIAECRELNLKPTPDGNPNVWKAAYRAVCWDLALFDSKWKARANDTPIPRRAAPPVPLNKAA